MATIVPEVAAEDAENPWHQLATYEDATGTSENPPLIGMIGSLGIYYTHWTADCPYWESIAISDESGNGDDCVEVGIRANSWGGGIPMALLVYVTAWHGGYRQNLQTNSLQLR